MIGQLFKIPENVLIKGCPNSWRWRRCTKLVSEVTPCGSVSGILHSFIDITTLCCHVMTDTAVLEIFPDTGIFPGLSRPVLPFRESPQSPDRAGGLLRWHGVALHNRGCLDGHLPILGGCLPTLRQYGVAPCDGWSPANPKVSIGGLPRQHLLRCL